MIKRCRQRLNVAQGTPHNLLYALLCGVVPGLHDIISKKLNQFTHFIIALHTVTHYYVASGLTDLIHNRLNHI